MVARAKNATLDKITEVHCEPPRLSYVRDVGPGWDCEPLRHLPIIQNQMSNIELVQLFTNNVLLFQAKPIMIWTSEILKTCASQVES